MKDIQWSKVLVFVNLVLAIGMAIWAFGLYTGRIDWSNKQAKGNEPPGELTKRLASLKTADAALDTAVTRQRYAAAGLRLYEQRRPRDDNFFAQHLTNLQTGKAPIQIVSFQNGVMGLTAESLPVMVAPPKDWPNQPFKGLSVYEADSKTTQTALLESIAEYQKLVQQDSDFIARIIGDKGLRQQLFNEVDVKQARIKKEIEDLKPLYINVLVESQILDKRQKALQARVEELKKAATRAAER